MNIRELHAALGALVAEDPEIANAHVALSADEEGNRFQILGHDWYSIETISESYTGRDTEAAAEYDGKPVLVIWPGWPMIELGTSESDD